VDDSFPNPLMTKIEIAELFSDSRLYELKSFQIIKKETLNYDINRDRGGFLEEACNLRKAFLSGHTIIVNNLEITHKQLREKAAKLGREVNIHLYLVPQNGSTSFPFHKDDRDVLVHLLYGTKDFEIIEQIEPVQHTLKSGDELFIKRGVQHRAIVRGGSALLSFGMVPENHYEVYGSITEDLLR